MLLRILELCLSIAAIAFTTTEVVLPLMREKPLFPMFKKTIVTTTTTERKDR